VERYERLSSEKPRSAASFAEFLATVRRPEQPRQPLQIDLAAEFARPASKRRVSKTARPARRKGQPDGLY
jgi:hypothetical protein